MSNQTIFELVTGTFALPAKSLSSEEKLLPAGIQAMDSLRYTAIGSAIDSENVWLRAYQDIFLQLVGMVLKHGITNQRQLRGLLVTDSDYQRLHRQKEVVKQVLTVAMMERLEVTGEDGEYGIDIYGTLYRKNTWKEYWQRLNTAVMMRAVRLSA